MSNIDATSIIHKNAIIAKNVIIKEYVIIHDEVTIGENTIIDSHTIIKGKTTIGKNNRIFSHSVIGSIPQDLKYKGEEVELIIGDNNVIREFISISPGTKNGGRVTKIGNNNLIMSHVHIGHDTQIGNNCVLSSQAVTAGHVVLGDNVILGGKASIHQFVNVGSFAMISGMGFVKQDVPPFCLAVGVPSIIHSINTIGLRRSLKFTEEEIEILKNLHKRFFVNPSKSIKKIAQDILDSRESSKNEIEMANFILKKSTRGIAMRKKDYYE